MAPVILTDTIQSTTNINHAIPRRPGSVILQFLATKLSMAKRYTLGMVPTTRTILSIGLQVTNGSSL